MAAGEGIDLNVNALPRQQTLLDHLGDSFSAVTPTEQGVLITNRGVLPLAELVINPATAPIIAGAAAIPALKQARDSARRAQSANNLMQIGRAIHTYNSDNDGAWPEDLNMLVEKKYITKEVLIAPQAPLNRNSYIYIKPEGEAVNPGGHVLVYENPAINPDGGGNILYLDGHVDMLDRWEFQERLRRPKGRGGIEAAEEGQVR
jgi:prepilin-type processing-associated H-X9-DG protein